MQKTNKRAVTAPISTKQARFVALKEIIFEFGDLVPKGDGYSLFGKWILGCRLRFGGGMEELHFEPKIEGKLVGRYKLFGYG